MFMQKSNILLTGAKGFFGAIAEKTLAEQGNRIIGLGRSKENDVICDLAHQVPDFSESFDIIIHAAGKAHSVPKTPAEEKDFFLVNRQGTENLLKGLTIGNAFPKAIVFISSIAVYGLSEGENITEEQALAPNTPYGRSKLEAEGILREWCQNRNCGLIIFRLPLIAGVGAPGNLQTMINAMKGGFYRSIGRGAARKSMVMASDVAEIIPVAVDYPGVYNLTDGEHPSFQALEHLIAKQLGRKTPGRLPYALAKMIASAGDQINRIIGPEFPLTTLQLEKITSTLTFDDSKARRVFGWNPQKVLNAFRIS
jgi:GlcNAc-P-P-Und epimerase